MWRKFEQLFQKLGIGSFCRNYPYPDRTVFCKNYAYLIRAAKEADIKGILAIERNVYGDEILWSRSDFLSEFRSIQQHLYLVIERNHELVAFLGSRVDNDCLHLTSIAVMKKYQHQGLAYLLLKELVSFSEKNRNRKIILEVNINNKRAQGFYRHFGFISNKIIKNYYRNSMDDAIKMEYIL
jgi:ribosomal-protein-alanine N-acetyltransferase